MKHIQVQFNTRARTVKTARAELRARCRKSPGFLRLLRLAANEQLKGNRPKLKASNRAALCALEYAVCKLRQQNEISLSEGVAARPAYLMKMKRENGRAWTEVHKATAVNAMKRTTADTLAVMPVWVYSPTISHRAAAKLDKLTAPELVTLEEAPLEYRENRESESAHPNPFTEDASTFNDAGELETPTERRERLTREHKSPRVHRETWEDADAPLPLLPKVVRPARSPARRLPAAPWYCATEEKMDKAAYAVLTAEREAYQERRAELDADEREQLEHTEFDECLAPEDLEQDMLEPWEALERYVANC